MKPVKLAAEMTIEELGSYIDHSVLKPEFTDQDIRRETENAVKYHCKTVCINPAAAPIVVPICEGTPTGVCIVVDCPFGTSSTASRVEQAERALAAGATEIDVVANFGWIRSGRLDDVQADLKAVVDVCHRALVPIKVILETDALTVDEVRAGVEVSIAAGADFVKTSTGFYSGEPKHEQTGASDAMVALMQEAAAGRALVKGSGSIRDREHFLRLIDAGIDRMGVGYKSTPVVLGLQEDQAGQAAGGKPNPGGGY